MQPSYISFINILVATSGLCLIESKLSYAQELLGAA